MNRRELFSGGSGIKPQRQRFDNVDRTNSGLNTYSGTWTIAEVKHLLKRTMFGAKKSDIDYFLSLGFSNSIDTLLETINHPAYSAPSLPLNNYSNIIADPLCAAGLPWPGIADTNNSNVYTYTARKKSLKAWWLSQMISQPRSLREKMTLFWSNHFVIEFDVVNVSTYVYNYNALLREHALNNFKTLTHEMTINCAMLKYLNGDKNTAAAPNENYARELQELFTIGKDSNGLPQYTEDDVQTAARALTGWKTDLNNNSSLNGFNSYFEPNKHDSTDKTFSAWYNNAVITGKSGVAGADELNDLINMIFQRNEVASFICRKLYTWFVYYEIDNATETNVIQPLADIFRNNNYDIVPVLSALFKSEHFFDVLNRGCMIKNPVDFSVGLCREFNIVFPDASDITAQYAAWDKVRSLSATFQFDIGDPPNVAGLPAYYQEPSYHELWINSDTLPKRNQFTDRMTANGYTYFSQTIFIDTVAFTASLTNPSDPEALIAEVITQFYAIDLTPGLETYLLSILLSGQTSNHYWTDAWNDYTDDPTDVAAYNIVETRLKSFYKYIMDLSEYQLS